MIINMKKMEAQGFEVQIDDRQGTIGIFPCDPVRLDWSPMGEQFSRIALSENEIELCLEKASNLLSDLQIFKAIRNLE